MKRLLLTLTLSSALYAAEAPKPSPVPLFSTPKQVASYDPSTGRVTYEKDADPKEVVVWLIQEAQKLAASVQELQKALQLEKDKCAKK